MIKLEHVVLASPEQMEFIIQGMRNPMNSHDRSDSESYSTLYSQPDYNEEYHVNDQGYFETDFHLGDNDHDLMQRLSNAGTEHRKYLRMMPVYVRITAPLYWWKEFSTYKVGTVANSSSTMHKIHAKEFTLEDFSTEHLMDFAEGYSEDDDLIVRMSVDSPKKVLLHTIEALNYYREMYLHTKVKPMKDESKRAELMKKYWWQMIQLLPSSYNYIRNVMMNYEVLANIYKSRRGHKLTEWRDFCKWIESLPYSELITGEEK